MFKPVDRVQRDDIELAARLSVVGMNTHYRLLSSPPRMWALGVATVDGGLGIAVEDLARRLALVDGEQDGDQPASVK